MEINRIACGAIDCIYCSAFRCMRDSIEIDETSKCMSYEKSN